MKSLKELESYFQKVIPYKDGFKAMCPCHNDKKQSIAVRKGDKLEGYIVTCFAGCQTKDILNRIGLEWSDIRPCDSKEAYDNSWKSKLEWFYSTQVKWKDDNGVEHTGYGEGVKVVADYQYRDEEGVYQYSKVRLEGGQIDGKILTYRVIDYANGKSVAGKGNG